MGVTTGDGEFSCSFALREELAGVPQTDYAEYFLNQNVVLTPIRVFSVETNVLATLSGWKFDIETPAAGTIRP